jgi:hypothetical protein
MMMFLMGEAEDGSGMDKVRASGRAKLFGQETAKTRCDAMLSREQASAVKPP